MDIRHMRVLKTVISTGSTSAAAKTLNVSQPAISKTIKLIEEEIQMPLFERSGGKLQPRLEALTLLPDINHMLSSYDTMRQRIDEIRSGRRGLIKVAAAAMVASGLLPGAIVRYRGKHPNVDFSITTTTTREVMRLVAGRKVDIGVCQRAYGLPSMSSRTIGSAQVVCAMRTDHPLAQQTEVVARDLMPYPLIMFDFNDPLLGSRVADTFSREGLYPAITMESNLSFTSFALVQAGLGVAIADSYTPPMEGVTTRPYKPVIDLQVHAIFPTDGALSPLLSSFCDDLSEFSSDLQASAPVSAH